MISTNSKSKLYSTEYKQCFYIGFVSKRKGMLIENEPCEFI
jgi:hypothetical protein